MNKAFLLARYWPKGESRSMETLHFPLRKLVFFIIYAVYTKCKIIEKSTCFYEKQVLLVCLFYNVEMP